MTEKKKSTKKRKAAKKTEDLLHEKVKATVGRGVEAFFGSEAAAAEEASPPEEAPPSDGSETTPEHAEDVLGAMLDREVMAAGSAHEEVATASAARAAEGPPAPEITAPPPEETLPPSPEAGTAQPAAETPPPTGGEESGAPPSRLYPTGTLVETPMAVEVTPPLPEEGAPYEIPQPPTAPETTLSREEIVQRISQQHFDRLEKDISRLYEEVSRQLATNKSASNQALESLREARALLWGAPERLVDAEYDVNQVKTLLERFQRYVEWGRKYGNRLLAYEVCCLIVFLGAFLAIQIWQTPIVHWVKTVVGTGGSTTYIDVLIPFLTSLMWGGIGGVVGALYSLWWHVAHEQDFDKRYIMWYLVQPIMGFILGGIVFLIIATGFLALEGTVPTTESSRGVQMFPALVAVLGGFRQQFVYELLERIIRVLTPQPEEGQG